MTSRLHILTQNKSISFQRELTDTVYGRSTPDCSVRSQDACPRFGVPVQAVAGGAGIATL